LARITGQVTLCCKCSIELREIGAKTGCRHFAGKLLGVVSKKVRENPVYSITHKGQLPAFKSESK